LWHNFSLLYIMINIIDVIQKRTPYPELQKIDPNSQEIAGKPMRNSAELVGQATIPAVLTAVYKHSRNDDDAATLLRSESDPGLLHFLFDERENEVKSRIADYAGIAENQVQKEMETVATEAVHVIREFLGREASPQRLRTFMNDQRHNILVYLPAALQLGDLLKDDTLDDRTNKMEGPVSNFMHKLEDKFNQGGQ
jgi:hypothetical protein